MSDKPRRESSVSAGINPGHFGRGGMGGMGMPVQKAKDFKGTIKRLLNVYAAISCFYPHLSLLALLC